MNPPSKEDILRLKILKAKNALSEAEKLLEYNFTNAALNRLYYACFYAATALLFNKDIFVKTHSGVKQMLGLHFVNTGILSKDLAKFYGDVFTNRLASDYDDFVTADYDMVKEFSLFAHEFVSKTQSILNL